MKPMPKKVDHRVRRREITDAVVRITLRGGLHSATFREIAAEAGVSVRLVQYYFGSKDQLLLSTQQHVADTLGLSLVHTNRTLRRLMQRKLIAWRDGGSEVLDFDGLKQLARWPGLSDGKRPLL